MHRCMTTWHGFTANYHDPVYNFFLLCHMTQKSISWVEKLWKSDYFLTLKIILQLFTLQEPIYGFILFK